MSFGPAQALIIFLPMYMLLNWSLMYYIFYPCSSLTTPYFVYSLRKTELSFAVQYRRNPYKLNPFPPT